MVILDYPKEKIILYKTSGKTYEVNALVDSEVIHSDDISIPIEPKDYFERRLPSGALEYYEVIDAGYKKGGYGIPDHYQTKVRRINAPMNKSIGDECKKKVFISHASEDKEYTGAFIELLFGLGLDEDDMVCSSYPGVGIPLQENIYEWLVEHFRKCDLHVIYFLSHNYYRSAACLNEMGAAWAMKQKWVDVLLPDFDFSDISGCIDDKKIGIKLDGSLKELKHRLGELKDDIVSEFGLKSVSATRWETIRDKFITTIQGLAPIETKVENVKESILIESIKKSISVYAYIMLLFAAMDDGKILVIKTLDGTSYQAGKTVMVRSQKPRELAFWDEALEMLLEEGYIKEVSEETQIYKVTVTGFSVAERFLKDNNIDIAKGPAEILSRFEATIAEN